MSKMSELHAAINGADPFMALSRLALANLPEVDLYDMLCDGGHEPDRANSRTDEQLRTAALIFAITDPGRFVRALAPYIGAGEDDPVFAS